MIEAQSRMFEQYNTDLSTGTDKLDSVVDSILNGISDLVFGKKADAGWFGTDAISDKPVDTFAAELIDEIGMGLKNIPIFESEAGKKYAFMPHDRQWTEGDDPKGAFTSKTYLNDRRNYEDNARSKGVTMLPMEEFKRYFEHLNLKQYKDKKGWDFDKTMGSQGGTSEIFAKLQEIFNNSPNKELIDTANQGLVDANSTGEGLTVTVDNADEFPKGENTTAFSDLATGTENLLTGAVDDIISGQKINTQALGMSFSKMLLGSLFGSFSGGGGVMDLLFGANGGIAAGGFKAFAKGGLVTKPTLGLVGEGKYNEAVVPLPDGRSIPISGATGSTENNVTVNVTIDSDGNAKSDSGMDGDTAKQLGYMVSQAVQAELVDQKRPGGLLSQY
jgi:hypothetical protein